LKHLEDAVNQIPLAIMDAWEQRLPTDGSSKAESEKLLARLSAK
jgi:hypothetical protein